MISNAEDRAANLEKPSGGRMGRSYARRHGDYLYDIEIHEAVPAGHAGRFCATVVNVVRLAPGEAPGWQGVTTENIGNYREYLGKEQRSQPGCIAVRMQSDFTTGC
jgi:hypothetical protein